MYIEIDRDDSNLKRSPFKSCAVPRVIGWLSTISTDGKPNLAPYSQFTNITFDPPYVLVSINRTPKGEKKDTARNIEQQGEFVYNMVTYDLREQMNITAIDYPEDVDEFEKAHLTKAPSVIVKPYRVEQSPIQLECKYYKSLVIEGRSKVGTSDVIIGRVVALHIKDEVLKEDGKIDIEKIKPLARLGYCDYTVVEKVFELLPSKKEGVKEDYNMGLEGRWGFFK